MKKYIICKHIIRKQLNNLMLMKCEMDLGDKLNLDKVVNRWSMLKQRRLNFK